MSERLSSPRFHVFPLRRFSETRGELTVLEEATELPFAVKRFYFIKDVRYGEGRGFHAHVKLEQVFVMFAGSVDISLSDGRQTSCITLQSSGVGLYVGPMVWRELNNFSEDAICGVFASHVYDDEDYIRSKKTFFQLVQKVIS